MVEKKGVQSIACIQVIDGYLSDRSKGEVEALTKERMLRELGVKLLQDMEEGIPYTVVMFKREKDLSPQSLEDVARSPFSKGSKEILIEINFCNQHE
jgi:hypothetical protein